MSATSNKCGYCVPCFEVNPRSYLDQTFLPDPDLTSFQNDAVIAGLTNTIVSSQSSRYPRISDDGKTITHMFSFSVCLKNVKCMKNLPQTNIRVANLRKHGGHTSSFGGGGMAQISAMIANEICLGTHPRGTLASAFPGVPQDRLNVDKVCCDGCGDTTLTGNQEGTCTPCCDLLKERVVNISVTSNWGPTDATRGCFNPVLLIEMPYTAGYGASPLTASESTAMNQAIQNELFSWLVWKWNDLTGGTSFEDRTESTYTTGPGVQNILNPRKDGVLDLLRSKEWGCCLDCPTKCC